MCKCTPEIRTPFCGKPGCEWPKEEVKPKPEAQASYKLSKYEYQHIYTHHIEKLKARLLNLADSMTTDQRQANSIKGLMKDFCNLAHIDGREELDRWAIEREIINKDDLMPVSNLQSHGNAIEN